MSKIFTIEDVNSIIAGYYNHDFIKKTVIDIGHNNDFTDVHFNYFTISRSYDSDIGEYFFEVTSDNSLVADGPDVFFPFDNNGNFLQRLNMTNTYFECSSDTPIIHIYHAVTVNGQWWTPDKNTLYVVKDYTPKMVFLDTSFDLEYDMLDLNGDIEGQTFTFTYSESSYSAVCRDNKITFNNISIDADDGWTLEFNGYVLHYTSFKIAPNIPLIDDSIPNLVNGKINHVSITAELGEYDEIIDSISFECDYPILNKYYDEINKELSFDVDLRGTDELKVLDLNILLKEGNSLMYPFSQSFKFNVEYNLINNESDLLALFVNGGVGRLGSDITLNSNITVSKDIYLIGNDCTLNLNEGKIIVPSDKTFKADDTIFTNGENTIQQLTGSIVELSNCSFLDCTGLGSVIDCQVNVGSLDNPNDFTTSLTNCNISNCDMAILHGGDLNVTECNIDGKIGNKEYPYFLYQTDGNAEIIKSNFNISSDTQIEEDIEFNSCIFTCGETAIINGLSREELSTNNINSFISIPQNNTSTINLTYYYDLIEDYITLTATNGYCHAVSQTDYVFKTNVSIERS